MDQSIKKTYYENFKKNNVEKIKEKKICPLCDGTYSYFNKYHHEKSKKHIHALKIIEKYKKENVS